MIIWFTRCRQSYNEHELGLQGFRQGPVTYFAAKTFVWPIKYNSHKCIGTEFDHHYMCRHPVPNSARPSAGAMMIIICDIFFWIALEFIKCFYLIYLLHDDIIKWRRFLRYWPFVRGIHGSLVNSPHKGPWCGALMYSLICAWTNGWVNNRNISDLRCHHTHYDLTVITSYKYGAWYLTKSLSTLHVNPKTAGTKSACISTVATDGLLLKHQAISIHITDSKLITLNQIHTNISYL